MDREHKKIYLRQYIELKRRIDSITEEVFFWNERATSPAITRLEQTGVRSSTHVNPVEKHLEVIDKLKGLEREANEKLNMIMKSIDTLDIPEQRTVLIYRYINDLYFHEIAKKMNYSLVGIYRLHQKALDNMQVYSSV